MKLNKILSALMLIAAVSFAACDDDNTIPDGPQDPTKDSTVVTQPDTTVTELGDTLSVANILKMKEDGTLAEKDQGTEKYWVKAYVVGSYNYDVDPKFVIGTANASNTSLLIADDPECEDTYAVASVKLAAGIFRDALNLQAHPENYKKEIQLYGVVEKYCGIGGVVKIEEAYLDGVQIVAPEIEIPTDTISCAEAVALAQALGGAESETEVLVKGYVTSIPYPLSQGTMSIWIADTEDGGNQFELYKVAPVNDVVPEIGALVVGKGKIKQYNSTSEINGGTVEVLKQGEGLQEGGVLTIAEFLEKQDTKGVYTLTGAVQNIKMDKNDPTQFNAYGNFDLVDETGTIYIYGLLTPDGQNKQFREMGIVEGDIITLKGTYTTYNGNPQIQNAIFVEKVQ